MCVRVCFRHILFSEIRASLIYLRICVFVTYFFFGIHLSQCLKKTIQLKFVLFMFVCVAIIIMHRTTQKLNTNSPALIGGRKALVIYSIYFWKANRSLTLFASN